MDLAGRVVRGLPPLQGPGTNHTCTSRGEKSDKIQQPVTSMNQSLQARCPQADFCAILGSFIIGPIGQVGF